MTETGEPLQRLLDELVATGQLGPQWVPSFRALPRHPFIPDTVWAPGTGTGPPLVVVRRDQDPAGWQALADGDSDVITQVDDGQPGPDPQRWVPTSSTGTPAMVARMLALLDVGDGHRVLEIGTGTGWTAALLAHRLGADQVTTVEIDPEVATQARKALSGAGFGGVTVITGEGALGYPYSTPFDRVVVTAACERIPYSWVEQTRSGGLILIPWANTYFDGGLLALTVNADGTATGDIVGESWFGWLREQRPLPEADEVVADIVDPAAQRAALPTTWTEVHPYGVAGDQGAQLAISLRVPHCRHLYTADDPDAGTVWFTDPWSRSWASLTHTGPDDHRFAVQQAGPRRLWDEVEAAYHWWADAGRPDAGRWRFTVTPGGQRIALD